MRRSLGKGLSQLVAEQADGVVSELPLAMIVPNQRQPRTNFDDQALDELAASIKEHGVLQPLIVRPVAEGKYELIAGERRLRASRRAGLDVVPVVVRAASAQGSLELALIENLQREDIGAMESARAYRRLVDEFSLRQEDIAGRVGKSRASIANTLRLLKLPAEVQEGLEQGLISEGHARALLSLESPTQQVGLFHRIVSQGLSVRDVEKVTRPQEKRGTLPRTKSSERKATDPNWSALEEGLSVYFGSPTRLEAGEIGGRMVVEFYSDDDLQRILDVLGIHL
jgi:ParB family chromosome partitioning protein